MNALQRVSGGVGIGVALLVFVVMFKSAESAGDTVSIYIGSECRGPEYKLFVDRYRCMDLPNWISLKDYKMSVNTDGYCVRMYERSNCKVSIVRGSKKPVIFNGCRNPRQMGFSTFRSFTIVPC